MWSHTASTKWSSELLQGEVAALNDVMGVIVVRLDHLTLGIISTSCKRGIKRLRFRHIGYKDVQRPASENSASFRFRVFSPQCAPARVVYFTRR